MEPASEILTSPALIHGSVEVVEKQYTGKRRLRGTVVKKVVVRHLWGLLQVAPESFLRAYLRYACAWIQLLARWPNNPLLEACRRTAIVAARRGHRHRPAGMCRAFVDGARTVLELALTLHKRGLEAVLPSVLVRPKGRLEAVRAEHGGFLICVPHNTGSVFSSVGVSQVVPTVLVTKNSPSVERTRIALDLFEAMQVRVLMVRDANPFEMTRACLRALRDGRALAATVDRIDRTEGRAVRPFLGAPVGFGVWAARIAVHARAPIVPAYVTTRRGRVVANFGEPLVPETVEQGMAWYLDYFERWIAREPASWSFLADRRWGWVLRDAIRGRADSDGGLVNPDRVRPA